MTGWNWPLIMVALGCLGFWAVVLALAWWLL